MSVAVLEYAVVDYSLRLGDLRRYPADKAWRPLEKSNEQRIFANPQSPIFINASGMGYAACKFGIDMEWSSPDHAGYKLYHHIGSLYKSVIVRAIPSQNAVLSVDVADNGVAAKVAVRALFMSGRVAYAKEWPCNYRMRFLNLKNHIRAYLLSASEASINTKLRIVTTSGDMPRGNSLVWVPRSAPVAPVVPNRIIDALGVPSGARVRVRASGGVIKRPAARRVTRNVPSSSSSSGIRRYFN